jgi:hypothetical protein
MRKEMLELGISFFTTITEKSFAKTVAKNAKI